MGANQTTPQTTAKSAKSAPKRTAKQKVTNVQSSFNYASTSSHYKVNNIGRETISTTPTDGMGASQTIHKSMQKSWTPAVQKPPTPNGMGASQTIHKSMQKSWTPAVQKPPTPRKRTANEKLQTAPKKRHALCHQSTQNELDEYASMGPTSRKRQSTKVHLIMISIETYVYQNELQKANEGKDELFKQIVNLTNPSAEYFQNMTMVIRQIKNPVRQALFHVASSCKLIQEKDRNRMSLIANHNHALFSLVKELTCGRKTAETVLDYDLMKRGESPVIAEFLVTLMEDLYKRGCASVKQDEARSSRVLALMWLVGGLHKVEKFGDAIKLKIAARNFYDGIKNENMVNVHQTWGLCHKEEGQLQEALVEIQKARTMYHEINCTREETLRYINRHHDQIKELMKPRSNQQ